MASTFGLLVPGRAVDTNFQQVEPNKLLATIQNAGQLNHVVVFMTGLAPLPAGAAGCIFFSLPDPSAPPTWHYLGHLTNEKPSAIYRLTNLTAGRQRSAANCALNGHLNPLAFNYTQAPVLHVAQLGISIEPLDAVLQMVPAIDNSAANVSSFTEFINKTVGNLYNYCLSFSRPASDLLGNPFQSTPPSSSAQYIPLSTIQTWYESYTRRLCNDQNFWKTLN